MTDAGYREQRAGHRRVASRTAGATSARRRRSAGPCASMATTCASSAWSATRVTPMRRGSRIRPSTCPAGAEARSTLMCLWPNRTRGCAPPSPKGSVTPCRPSIPEQPVEGITTIDQIVSQSTSDRRFYAVTTGAFAAVALALAIAGIFGVVSRTVSERRRELAIRVALGADPAPAPAARVWIRAVPGRRRHGRRSGGGLRRVTAPAGLSVPDRADRRRDLRRARPSPCLPSPRSPATCPRAARFASSRWPCSRATRFHNGNRWVPFCNSVWAWRSRAVLSQSNFAGGAMDSNTSRFVAVNLTDAEWQRASRRDAGPVRLDQGTDSAPSRRVGCRPRARRTGAPPASGAS